VARPRDLDDETPSASCGSVNEVSAGGRVKRPHPMTRVLHPVSGQVVCSSRSGNLIHQSRQAGWGLGRFWRDRLSRRPASPIRTRRMGSGQNDRPGRGDEPPGLSEPLSQAVWLYSGSVPRRLEAYATNGESCSPSPRPSPAAARVLFTGHRFAGEGVTRRGMGFQPVREMIFRQLVAG